MNDNFQNPRQVPGSGVILCGEDDDGPAERERSVGETEPTVRHVIAGFVATLGQREIEAELVTTDVGQRYRWRFPKEPVGQGWSYMEGPGLAAYYIKVRAGFLAKMTWEVTDTVEANDLLVAMARHEAAEASFRLNNVQGAGGQGPQ